MPPRHRTLVTSAALAALALPAVGRAQTLTFEGISDFYGDFYTYIGDYYAGGAGPDYGVTFSPNAVALCLNTAGRFCSNSSRGGRGDPASQGAALDFRGGSQSFIERAAGFTSFAFVYAAAEAPATVSVWSGSGGTGALLATLLLPRTPTGPEPCYGAQYCPFVAASVAFAGTARSVTFGAGSDELILDDVTFGPAAPRTVTPEPAPWALVAAGLAALLAAGRRRGVAAAVVALAAIALAVPAAPLAAQPVLAAGVPAGGTLLTFNALAAHTPVTTQFAALGVTIGGACAESYLSNSFFGGDPVQLANVDFAATPGCPVPFDPNGTRLITFAFAAPVHYFGLRLVGDGADTYFTTPNGQLQVYASSVNGPVTLAVFDPLGFTSLSVGAGAEGGLIVDDVRFAPAVPGRVVPEPAPAALIGAGLAALAGATRGRRRG